jgi:hypothetical protein
VTSRVGAPLRHFRFFFGCCVSKSDRFRPRDRLRSRYRRFHMAVGMRPYTGRLGPVLLNQAQKLNGDVGHPKTPPRAAR